MNLENTRYSPVSLTSMNSENVGYSPVPSVCTLKNNGTGIALYCDDICNIPPLFLKRHARKSDLYSKNASLEMSNILKSLEIIDAN